MVLKMNIRNSIGYTDINPENREQLLNLYNSVGWTRYTADLDKLIEAIHCSSYVISSYHEEKLVGLIRGLSDDVSINFIQDLLVHQKYQRLGIGCTLLKKAIDLYPQVHKHVLLTDNEEFQKNFYESLGFKNLTLSKPKMNAFVNFIN